jgi:preprotein translocase subunit YajC
MLSVLLFAQQQPEQPSFWVSMMPIFLLVLVGYFLLFRPMQKQEKQRQAMIAALKKNDKVLTTGGILGTVANIKDDEVTLKVDDSSNVKIRVVRSAIQRILSSEEASREQKDGGN